MKRVLVTLTAVLIFGLGSGLFAEDGDGFSAEQKIKMNLDQAKKYMEAGAFQQAKKCLKEEVLKIDKKNFEAHFLMGLCFYREQNLGGTMTWMLMALKINPNHQQANYYVGKAELDLEHLDKAAKYLKAASKAKDGLFPDPGMQTLIVYYYGVCLVKQKKGKEGAKILNELAAGGKFETFGTRKDVLRNIYFEGYMYTGEAYTHLGLFDEADRWLTKALANGKQVNEGKIPGNQLWTLYRFNKFRVPKRSIGQVQGDVFMNTKSFLKVKKVKGWDFVFYHPECYQIGYSNAEAAYKQNEQSECAAIWLIHKTKERMYEKVVEFQIKAWELQTSLTISGESVQLSSPKDVTRTTLKLRKDRMDPIFNRKIRPPMPVVTKMKFNRKYRGATFKGSFESKQNKEYKEDFEFWCFVGKTHSYFIEITGDHGMFKKYGREIETMKRSIELTK